MDASPKEEDKSQTGDSDFRTLDAGAVYRTIADGASDLRGSGDMESLMWADLMECVANDVACAPQNLIAGKAEGYVGQGGELRIGIGEGSYDSAKLVRQPTWETAFRIAQFYARNNPTLPENSGRKYCDHCSYWVPEDDISILTGFGTKRELHTECWKAVTRRGRPLGELIPPHRRAQHGRG